MESIPNNQKRKIIDLVWLGNDNPGPVWSLGKVFPAAATPAAVDVCIQSNLESSSAEAWLFWDETLGVPDPQKVLALLDQPDDAWHAGLALGMGGKPHLINFVHPTWMLNRDPANDTEATSWRMSLNCCLIRTEVLRKLGGPKTCYQSLQGASLEMGHRYLQRGANLRFLPDLLSKNIKFISKSMPIEDELRFVFDRYGKSWSFWALVRAAFTGCFPFAYSISAINKISHWNHYQEPEPFFQVRNNLHCLEDNNSVTVIIPTLKRYPYLRQLLNGLREQTVPPLEIIIIDQTPKDLQDQMLLNDFADLPLKLILQDEPGQCSSRNAGLAKAKGDYILIIDDDDEVEPDLIEKHLSNLLHNQCNVSCGAANEIGAGHYQKHLRIKEQVMYFRRIMSCCKKKFYTNPGYLIWHSIRARADYDLGMRIY